MVGQEQDRVEVRGRPLRHWSRVLSASVVLATVIPPLAQASFWSERLPIEPKQLWAVHVALPCTCVTTFHVAKAGSDANDGSREKPWLTISHAVAVLGAKGTPQGGVCVEVEAGIYRESVNAGSLSGSSDSATGYFVLRSAKPHGAKIEVPLGLPDYSDGIRFMNANFIVIDGFEISGHVLISDNRDGSGIVTFGDSPAENRSHHIKILNNIVHDVGSSGIASQHADQLEIEGNVVYHTSNTSVWGVSAINVYHPVPSDDRPGFHIVVRGNISYDSAEVDINAEHWDGNGITFDDFNASQDSEKGIRPYLFPSLVENNLCFGNGGAGFMTGGGGSNFVTVRNNTLCDNDLDPKNTATLRGEITIFKSRDVLVVNNVCVANPGANANNRGCMDADAPGGGNRWVSNLSFSGTPGDPSFKFEHTPSRIDAQDGNLLGVDPLFVDMKGGDFRLRRVSPAIGSGATAFDVPADDLQGRIRSGKPDLGAYAAP